MISTITDVPENVAAFRATGDVDKGDYNNVVIPVVDALVKKQGSINFMLVLDTSLTNFSAMALMKDLGIGLKHFTKWHKMAIISESGAIKTFTDLFSYVAPGQAKGFTHAQMEEATRWVST
ncbi:MAG: STAS/SEC14 domain-containing protein [Bacteroidota bacterium]